MRYIIDAEGKQAIQEIRQLETAGTIKVIEAGNYDKIGEKVARVAEAVKTMKDAGLPEELIVNHIAQKSKIGVSTVEKVLRTVDELYAKFGERK